MYIKYNFNTIERSGTARNKSPLVVPRVGQNSSKIVGNRPFDVPTALTIRCADLNLYYR